MSFGFVLTSHLLFIHAHLKIITPIHALTHDAIKLILYSIHDFFLWYSSVVLGSIASSLYWTFTTGTDKGNLVQEVRGSIPTCLKK